MPNENDAVFVCARCRKMRSDMRTSKKVNKLILLTSLPKKGEASSKSSILQISYNTVAVSSAQSISRCNSD